MSMDDQAAGWRPVGREMEIKAARTYTNKHGNTSTPRGKGVLQLWEISPSKPCPQLYFISAKYGFGVRGAWRSTSAAEVRA